MGQRHGERGAATEARFDRHGSAVHLDDALDDRQPEPAGAAAGLAGAGAPEEPVEDSGQVGGIDPDAVVLDLDDRTALAGASNGDLDHAAAGGELQGVADEVRDDLADPDRVVADPDRLPRKIHRQGHAAPPDRRRRPPHGLLDARAYSAGPDVAVD